jgi:protease I
MSPWTNRTIMTVCWLLLAWPAGSAAAPSAGDTRPVVLLVIAPEAYSEAELKAVQEALPSRKVRCLIGSTQGGEAKGMVQGSVRVDVLLEQVQPANVDALVLIGGSGAKMYLWFNPEVKRLVRGLNKIHRPLGAISIAPAALVYAGVLAGRKASVLPAPETLKLFEQNSVALSQTEVTVDGNLVTCSTSQGALALGQVVARQLPRKSRAVSLDLPPAAPPARPKPTVPLPLRRKVQLPG